MLCASTWTLAVMSTLTLKMPSLYEKQPPLSKKRQDYLTLVPRRLPCSVESCSDEFDYTDIRKEFVHNSVAEEEEGLQNRIFAHLLGPNEYAARVHDFNTYGAISRDMIRRWIYPVVPDNLPSGYERKYHYKYSRNFIYKETKGNTVIDRSTKINDGCIIGASANIGRQCVLSSSVIGNNVTVGDNVTLTNSHLWNGVKVGSNVFIDASVICENVVVLDGATVSKGCVIGKDCIIGNKDGTEFVIPAFSRVTCSVDTEGDDDEDEYWSDTDSAEGNKDNGEQAADPTSDDEREEDIVGTGGKGRLWKMDNLDDSVSDFEDSVREKYRYLLSQEAQSIGFDRHEAYKVRLELQKDDEEGSAAIEDDFAEESGIGQDGGSWGEDGAVDGWAEGTSAAFITGRQRGVDVVKELKNLCLEHDENASLQNLAIELNSYKFSQNATYEDVNCGAVLSLGERVTSSATDLSSTAKVLGSFKAEFTKWKDLFTKCSPRKSDEAGIIFGVERMLCLQDFSIFQSKGGFRFLLQTLYDLDILSEDAIGIWREKRSAGEGSEALLAMFNDQTVQDFLEWIDESEEEDSSDED